MSKTTCTNGSAVRGDDLGDRCGEQVGARASRMPRDQSGGARPGAGTPGAGTPSRPVISASSGAPSATLTVPDDVDQPVAPAQRAVQRGDRVDEDVAVGQHLVGDRVAEQLAGAGGQVALRARCRARPRSRRSVGRAAGSSRARPSELTPSAQTSRSAVAACSPSRRRSTSRVRRRPRRNRSPRGRAGSGRHRTGRAGTGRSCSRTRTGTGAAARTATLPSRCRNRIQSVAEHTSVQPACPPRSTRIAQGRARARRCPAPRACSAVEERSNTRTSQPSVAQHQGRGQAAERAADDDDHAASPVIGDRLCPRELRGGRRWRPGSTLISNSTRRSSMDGSRSAYGGSSPVYLTQILFSWSVTRWPSAGSSSEISRLHRRS